MTFNQALNIILKERGHGNKKNNLAEVKKTAAALNLTKPPFKTVIIAGTNGKGTTAALLALALTKAGYKTGLFTSPHIYDITERISVNGANISKKDFAACVQAVLAAETVPLKFFEVLTLASMLYFKNSGAKYAVVECGIGGRYDCTNIFPRVLSIITSVDIDHSALLGNTLQKIAWQKGGIIKSGVPCISGPLAPQAKAVIKKIASSKKIKLLTLGNKFKIINTDYKKIQTVFCFEGNNFKLNLLGSAQAKNAALVCLAAQNLGISQKSLEQAFLNRKIPCRFEILPFGGRFIIKDGAHNPAAVKEFIKTYKSSRFYGDNTLVFASMQDKDYKTVCGLLAPHFKNIVLTCADKAKGVPPAVLAQCFGNKNNIKTVQNPLKINFNNLTGNIIIVGSFYLCAKVCPLSS